MLKLLLCAKIQSPRCFLTLRQNLLHLPPCSSARWPQLGAWLVQQPAHLFIIEWQSDKGDYKSQAAGATVHPPFVVWVCLQGATWLTGRPWFVTKLCCDMRCLSLNCSVRSGWHCEPLCGFLTPLLHMEGQTNCPTHAFSKEALLQKMLLLLLIMTFSGDQMHRKKKKQKLSLHSVSYSSEHCRTKCIPDETSWWEALSKYVPGFLFFPRVTWNPVFDENDNNKKTRHPL